MLTSQQLLETHQKSIRGIMFDLRVADGAVPREDLFQIGVEGMLEASRRFDPTLGVSFWTFAYPRVRGAMVDAMRRTMRLPVAFHRRLVAREAALRATEVGTWEHREAAQKLEDANEMAALLSPEALAIAWGESLGVDEDAPMDDDLDPTEGFRVAPVPIQDDGSHRVFRTHEVGADEQLETARSAAAIHAALRQLPLEERMIVRGLYFEGRGLLDIGADFGITKSWASRLHTRGLGRLKEILVREWGLDPVIEPPPKAKDAPQNWIAVLLEGLEDRIESTEAAELADAA